jgi:hypothetical protein
MRQRNRKLIGTFGTLAMLVVYALVVTEIYALFLTGLPTPVLLVYFAVTGLAWCLPTMVIIRWMAKPDQL